MASPGAVLRRNRSVYRALLRRARRAEDAGDIAAYVHLAAAHAWLNHPGFFRDPDAETLLREAGRRLSTPADRPPREAGTVLHVASWVNLQRGHGRLLWRWLQADTTRRQSVALTWQPDDVPAPLGAEVAARGGIVHLLATGRPTMPDRAAALRELGAHFEAIVLHVHPNDVVPWLAFADDEDAARVIVMNHADHVFWLGAPAVVANFRNSGQDLATRRRGLTHGALLPLPLESPGDPDRDAARAAIGVEPNTVVLLTMAAEQKYQPLRGRSLPDVVAPVLRERPDALLVAVGPRSHGAWAAAGERVRAVGPRSDPETWFAAADLYVDSYPLGSVTSKLEAAARGLPTLSYWPYGERVAVLSADDPAFREGPATTEHEFATRLRILIDDPGVRRAAGARNRAAVASTHDRSIWLGAVDALYATLPRVPSSPPAAPPPPDDLDLLLVEQAGPTQSFGALLDELRAIYPGALDGALPAGLRLYRRAGHRLPAPLDHVALLAALAGPVRGR